MYTPQTVQCHVPLFPAQAGAVVLNDADLDHETFPRCPAVALEYGVFVSRSPAFSNQSFPLYFAVRFRKTLRLEA